MSRTTVDISPEELRTLYVEELWSAKDIAARFVCSPTAILKRLDELGIPRRSHVDRCRLAKSGSLFDDAEAARMYQEGFSSNDITRTLGASKSTVLASLRNQGVPIRSKREAATLRRNTGERKRPKPSALRGVRECMICGGKESLELHHLNGIRSDDRPVNHVWLCWEHHLAVEYLIGQALIGLRGESCPA